MNAPSKKIILLIAAVILGGGIIYALFYAAPRVTYVAPAVSATSTENALLARDSDGDGLKDWEEELWKTDRENPDSDGDGAPDGEEIKLGRNPLAKGPNDKLDTDTVLNKINTETEKDLSETDKFSRELFMKIVAAKNADTPPTEADLKAFLNASIQTELANQKLKSFSESDFQVDTEETPEKIKAYGNAVAAILQKPPPQKLEYELNIVDRAEAKKDPSELKKLTGNIAAYKRIEDALLALTVPQSALPVHRALTNAAAAMAWSITGLSYILTDPLKALPGVAGYAENFQAFFTSIHGFRGYFENAGTVFEDTDAGYQFFDAL